MKITCENCNTRFVLDASRLPPQGARVRCSRCQHRFHVKPDSSAPEPDAIAEKVLQDSAPEGVAGPLEAGDDASLDNPQFLFDEPSSSPAPVQTDDEDPPSRPLLGDPREELGAGSHMLGEEPAALDEGEADAPSPQPASAASDSLFGEAPASGYDESEPFETPSLSAPTAAPAYEVGAPPLEGLTESLATGFEEPTSLSDDFSLADSADWDDVAPSDDGAERDTWRGFARDEIGARDSLEEETPLAARPAAPTGGEPIREPAAWSALPALGSRFAAALIGVVILAAGVRAVPWHGLEALPGPASVRGAGWIASDLEAFYARGSEGARILVVRGSLAPDAAASDSRAASAPPRVLGQLARADGELVGRSFTAHAQRIEPLTRRTLAAWLSAAPTAPTPGARVTGFTLLIPDESGDAERFRLELVAAPVPARVPSAGFGSPTTPEGDAP